MAGFDLGALTAPISDAEPCGPDLDAAGDSAFHGFVSRVESLLPSSFLSFDAARFPFEELLADAQALARRTRDFRLLVLFAKLAALRRDLAGLTACVRAVADGMVQRWDDVHPRGEDGDFSLRMAPLYSLDDQPTINFPLQYMPLATAPRLGAVTYRMKLYGEGKAKPRDGEGVDVNLIPRLEQECDLAELRASRQALDDLRKAIGTIRNVAIDRAGYEQAVTFEQLPAAIDAVWGYADELVKRRDPDEGVAAAPAEETTDAEPDTDTGAAQDGAAPVVMVAAGPVLALSGPRAAALRLDAVLSYFERREPSSASLLLAQQARMLVGKNLREVLQILLPADADKARVALGGSPGFIIPVSALPESSAAAAGAGEEEPVAPVETREAALQHLETVARYYRAAEPSSPIPLLIDRIKALCTKDFLGLVRELIPEPPKK